MVGAIDISVAVLVVSAIMKLTDASATATLFSSLGLSRPGLPSARLARLAGTVELVVAASVLVRGGRVAAIGLAVVYAAVSVVLTLVLRSGARDRAGGDAHRAISCGCFGVRSAPPTRLHLALNLASVAAAVTAAVAPIDPLPTRLAELGADAVGYVLLVVIGAGLVIAAHTAGAEVAAELSSPPRPVRARRQRAGA